MLTLPQFAALQNLFVRSPHAANTSLLIQITFRAVERFRKDLGSVTDQEKDMSFFRRDESRCCEAGNKAVFIYNSHL